MRQIFSRGSKAEVLEALAPVLQVGRIPHGVHFSVCEWRADQNAVLADVASAFDEDHLIVRSSAQGEDGETSSMAGAFASIPFVSNGDRGELCSAVEEVIASYGRNGGGKSSGDRVLVQSMIEDISMSGVIMTYELNTGAPYYVVNYDDTSGRHDAITAGKYDTSRTLFIHRHNVDRLRSTRFARLLKAVREIENNVNIPGLDIEFLVTGNEDVFILQVRPMPVSRNWNLTISKRVNDSLNGIRQILAPRFAPVEGVLGRRSVFGIMPDWNPVEMLGAVPRSLASSLYQYLITDSVWAEARSRMGYRDQSGRPLMFDLGGRFYIDVRESFNSFLPADISDDVGQKLVDHWLDALSVNVELHDKIEFDVATTVHTPDFELQARKKLLDADFSRQTVDAFEHSLKKMTIGLLADEPCIMDREMGLVKHLSQDSDVGGGMEGVRRSLEQCREFGTRPFSILARCGFIAESFLRSFVNLEILTSERANEFRRSVNTVLSDFLNAAKAYQAQTMTESGFLSRFGHLRPGTYDILSKRYDQREDLLESPMPWTEGEHLDRKRSFVLTKEEAGAMDGVLSELYGIDANRMMAFMSKAIEGREMAKFEFTKNISNSLEMIAYWGACRGVSREALSHQRIGELFEYGDGDLTDTTLETIRERAERRREARKTAQGVKLPFLITEVEDIYVVPLLKNRPNFITRKRIRARAVELNGKSVPAKALQGRIILIEGADPGYDWIFMHKIGALVTKYGGVNSHMAIRCAELGIPAAIGCGEQIYSRLQGASGIELDCGCEKIAPAHGENKNC